MDETIKVVADHLGLAAEALCSHDGKYLVGADGYVQCTNCQQTIGWPQTEYDCMHFVLDEDSVCDDCGKFVTPDDFL